MHNKRRLNTISIIPKSKIHKSNKISKYSKQFSGAVNFCAIELVKAVIWIHILRAYILISILELVYFHKDTKSLEQFNKRCTSVLTLEYQTFALKKRAFDRKRWKKNITDTFFCNHTVSSHCRGSTWKMSKFHLKLSEWKIISCLYKIKLIFFSRGRKLNKSHCVCMLSSFHGSSALSILICHYANNYWATRRCHSMKKSF